MAYIAPRVYLITIVRPVYQRVWFITIFDEWCTWGCSGSSHGSAFNRGGSVAAFMILPMVLGYNPDESLVIKDHKG